MKKIVLHNTCNTKKYGKNIDVDVDNRDLASSNVISNQTASFPT